MKLSDLVSSGTLAKSSGVKMIGYGPAGGGKTPLIATAPRPIMLATEAGLLSMRGTNVPVWQAHSYERIKEFFDWFFKSHEAKQFDTLCADSLSQVTEIVLKYHLGRNKDGRKAYGEMASDIMKWLEDLYFMPDKHIYLIGKQEIGEEEGVQTKRPYFAGQELKVKIPHLFDLIAHIAVVPIQGLAQPQRAIRTKATFGVVARDRSGKLAELEPPDLTKLFNKMMQP